MVLIDTQEEDYKTRIQTLEGTLNDFQVAFNQLQDNFNILKNDYTYHSHNGFDGSQTLSGNTTLENLTLTGGIIKYKKTSFTDAVNAGYYINSNGIYFGLANNTKYLKLDLSNGTLSFSGALSASSLDIPDTTTANSFHVDTSGNAWWGATAIGSAVAKVLNTGAGTFSNITITGGTIGGQAVANVGYVATSGADAVPSGLTCSSTGITVANDGTTSAYVILTWTAISSNTFDHYLIRYKKASYTYYTYIPSTTNTITIEGLVPNTSYNFGICSVNKYGTSSAFSSDISQTTASDTTAPATVSGVSATAGIQYVIIQWTHNTESDLASYNIYRVTGGRLIDSYGETNGAAAWTLYNGSDTYCGQSFTNTGTITIDGAKFYLRKIGSPTGNIYVKIYAHTGTYGVSSKPTGAALATSDPVDISTLTTSNQLISFTFSGSNRITLNPSTYYVIQVNYSGGNSSNYLMVASDGSSPTHSGNASTSTDGSTWTSYNSYDTCFYIYSGTLSKVGNSRTNYFIDGGLTANTEYAYYIKAVDTSGNESTNASAVASATPRNVVSSDTNIASQGWTQTCVFSSTDADTVSWGAGTFTTAAGTSYSISAGNTGNMTAITYIYLDIAVSTTAYQITTTATNAVGDGKVLIAVAQKSTTEATFQVFGGSGGVAITGGDIENHSITNTQIAAATITSNEIAANTIVAGNIAAGTITSTQIATNTITSDNILSVAASKVLIDGTIYLSNWRKTGDLTKIDGGQISTNTVTLSQLNFTPVQTTNVIASINASAEGIKIDADNITISGATTFDSGYDPTTKTAKVGGTYDSAASGARVRIFPDTNTGIQVIDDGGNDVFKALVGGTNVGDVIIGNWAGNQGMFYDKSAGTFTFAGALQAPTGTLGAITAAQITLDTAGYIRGGQTDFNTGTGFFLGYSGSAYKFSVGNPSGDYMAWDGSNLRIGGAGLGNSAGNTILLKWTGSASTYATSWTKVVEVICGDRGTFRILFQATISAYAVGKARIYRNGVAVGTERTLPSGGQWGSWEEDIAGWQKGDLLQIYAYTNNDTYPVTIGNGDGTSGSVRVKNDIWTVTTY
jgi:hypothetical protein